MKLRDIRKQLGLNQNQLAELIGVKQATISIWESGAGEPTTKHIRKLVRVLNCTSDELLGVRANERTNCVSQYNNFNMKYRG